MDQMLILSNKMLIELNIITQFSIKLAPLA